MAQIGTIRVDTQNNGTVSVPVFDTGDSGSSIYEFVRVQTGSGTGFIPVEDTSNATYPYLRVQSQSHGTVAMTDRNSASAIPDTWLQDDFGDNKLTNRDGTETTTYEGQTWGSFRPEYSSNNGRFPSVSNQTVTFNNGETIETNYTLDFSVDIEWRYSIDISGMGSSFGNGFISLFGADLNDKYTEFAEGVGGSVDVILPSRGYLISFDESGVLNFERADDSDSTILANTTVGSSFNVTIRRDSSGNWDILVDGSLRTSVTDTTYTTVGGTQFHSRSTAESEFEIDSYEILSDFTP